jgi:hypothetical protein
MVSKADVMASIANQVAELESGEPEWEAVIISLEDAKALLSAPSAGNATMRQALESLLVQYEGVYDCVDNDGKRYQSQSAADAEAAARAALKAAPVATSSGNAPIAWYTAHETGGGLVQMTVYEKPKNLEMVYEGTVIRWIPLYEHPSASNAHAAVDKSSTNDRVGVPTFSASVTCSARMDLPIYPCQCGALRASACARPLTREDMAKLIERKAKALTEEYCHGDAGPGGYVWSNKGAEWQVLLLEELAEEIRNG